MMPEVEIAKQGNKIFSNYGPTWKRKRKTRDEKYLSYKEFPIPDGIDCGPVFSQKSSLVDVSIDATFLSEDTDVNKPKELSSLEVKIKKQVAKKFPLQFVLPCLKPLQQNVSTNVIPTSLKSDCHYANTLSSFSVSGSYYVIYGESCNDSQVVKIAKIKAVDSQNENLTLFNERNISKYHTFHQVDSAVINNIPYALLRLDDSISVIRVEEDSFTLHSVPGKGTTDCCLNRVLNDNFAFANEDGTVYIYNIVKNKSNWGGQFFIDPTNKNKWLGCEFGCHPLQLNVACESDMWLIDGRLSLSVDNSRKIFDIKNMGKYIYKNSEAICSFKSVPNLPYFYVICSETLLLMDNRYCKYPVLTWQHMIKGQPSYPHCFKENSLDVVLMADPLQSQLCLVPSYWGSSDYPDIEAVSTCKHFNVVKDTLTFARQNGIWFSDQIARHFNSSLVGLTTIPLQEKGGTLICLQNNFGTLFYMELINQTKMQDINVHKKRNTVRVLKQFEKELCRPAELNAKVDLLTVKCIEGLKSNKKKWRKIKSISKSSSSCKGIMWNLSEIFAENKRIPCYHIDPNAIKRIEKDNSPINFLPKKAHGSLDRKFLESCSDPLSEKLLSVWDTYKNVEINSETSQSTTEISSESGWFYRRCPLFLENEGIIPNLRKEISVNERSTNNTNENSTFSKSKAQSEVINGGECVTNKTLSNENEKSQHMKDFNASSSTPKTSRKKKRKSRADGF